MAVANSYSPCHRHNHTYRNSHNHNQNYNHGCAVDVSVAAAAVVGMAVALAVAGCKSEGKVTNWQNLPIFMKPEHGRAKDAEKHLPGRRLPAPIANACSATAFVTCLGRPARHIRTW